MTRSPLTTLLTCALSGLLLCGQARLRGQAEPAGRVGGAPRLSDCIEAPYAYVRLDGDSSGRSGAVERLLADPSLDAVFAPAPAGARPAARGSARALALVRGMIRRGASELELAMTGIVARGGQPLLVLRARLLREQADKLRLVLESGGELLEPARKLGGAQTYYLQGGRPGRAGRGGPGAAGPGAAAPGEWVELALVGNDLVVGNDGSAMREVLDPPRETSAGGRRVLSSDPRFLSLRDAQEVPSGSLLAYGDWQRLGRRLQSHLSGVPASLIRSSGLGAARSVMLVLAPADDAFAATLLLGFGSPGLDEDGPEERDLGGIDGWFAATKPVAARELLRELPTGGLGGMVLSVDLSAVAAHSPRSSHLVWDLRDAFHDFGLDFDRNVLERLAARGTVQLHFAPANGDALASVTPVYSVRAKNRRIALDLFGDIRRVVEHTELGKLVQVPAERGKRRCELLRLGHEGRFTAWLGVHDDSLLLAGDRATLVQWQEELQRARPNRRRDRSAAKAIKAIGGEDVAGLFDVDLGPLFERLSAAFPGADLSSLPKRHTGFLAIERRAAAADGANDRAEQAGPVVRIRLLSSR